MKPKGRPTARVIAAAILYILSYRPIAAETASLPAFSVSAPIRTFASDSDEWVPAESADAPLLAGIPEGKPRKAAHIGATALTVCGALLVAGGLATAAAGVSDDMDDETMHRGALMIVSGGVLSALFAVVMRATDPTSPE
jgi:hypothetical protein